MTPQDQTQAMTYTIKCAPPFVGGMGAGDTFRGKCLMTVDGDGFVIRKKVLIGSTYFTAQGRWECVEELKNDLERKRSFYLSAPVRVDGGPPKPLRMRIHILDGSVKELSAVLSQASGMAGAAQETADSHAAGSQTPPAWHISRGAPQELFGQYVERAGTGAQADTGMGQHVARRVHLVYLWGRRGILALSLAIWTLCLVHAFQQEYMPNRDRPGYPLADACLVAALLIALSLVPRALLLRILRARVRGMVRSLSRRSGATPRETLKAVAAHGSLAKDTRFLLLVDRVGTLLLVACRTLGNPRRRIFEALAHWLRVSEACGEPPQEPDRSIVGYSKLWQAIIYLLCAERTRIVSPVLISWGVTSLRETELCWHAAASEAINCANGAARYLGDSSEAMVKEILRRAEVQLGVTEEQAKQDLRYRVVERRATGGPIIAPAKVLRAPDWAALASRLKVADLLAFANQIPGNEVLGLSMA